MVWTTLVPVDGRGRQHDGGVVVLRPQGDLDLGAVPAFRTTIHRALFDVDADEPSIVIEVDLAAVDFVDSAGIGVLIGALRRVRQRGGSLRLSNVPVDLAGVFDVTGLDRVFEVVAP